MAPAELETTSSLAVGEVDPTPTFPPYGFKRRRLVVPADPIVKFPDADPMGPPKVVVPAPATARVVVVALTRDVAPDTDIGPANWTGPDT